MWVLESGRIPNHGSIKYNQIGFLAMSYYREKTAKSQRRTTNHRMEFLLPENRKLLQDKKLSLRDSLDWDDC